MRQRLRQHFGLPADPWAGLTLPTLDHRHIAAAVAQAVTTAGFVVIAGPRGAGKTFSLWRALEQQGEQQPVTVIEPLRLDRERLHMGDIQQAIVMQLSDETVRHSAEARAGQVRRLLAAADTPVLVIDEAQHLHHGTLRALKRLRELGARGRKRALLAVLLVGQSDPTVRISEVGLRSDCLALRGLTAGEIGKVLGQVLGKRIEQPASALLGKRLAGQTWLDMQQGVDDCLAIALAEGAKILTRDAVLRALGERSRPGTGGRTAPQDTAIAGALDALDSPTRSRRAA